jgi:bacillithiol biosynthesis deacetylase BshB1
MDTIDFLAVSPHPDDAELFCGGVLARAKRQGAATSIVDLSAGELSTRGDVDRRKMETTRASAILNLDYRANLGLPDGNLEDTPENRLKLIQVIRKLRPRICLLPYGRDRHPDHESAAALSRTAVYQAGLKKIDDGQEAYRPSTVLYYMLHRIFEPSFVVDISAEMETKMEAIRAYRSQFQNQDRGANTYISRPEFLESIITRARFYGYQINCLYGEPYFFDGTLKIDNVLEFFAYTTVL